MSEIVSPSVANNQAPTFAVGDGIATASFGSRNSLAYDLALQPDGRILVAGDTFDGSNSNFAIVRFNADGSLDALFNGSGTAVTDFQPTMEAGQALALQGDGGIVLAGYSLMEHSGASGDFNFVVLRYDSGGALDASFGAGGVTSNAVGPFRDLAYDVAIQGDGRIVVAGEVGNGVNADFGLARYNVDGSLDASFGIGGVVTTMFGSGQDLAYSIWIQPDGRILVGGQAWTGNSYDFALARYNSDGSLDVGFGRDGLVTIEIGEGHDVGYDVTTDGSGNILIVGYYYGEAYSDLALVRLLPDGALDTSFGGGGIVTTAVGAEGDSATSVNVQSDGRILVAGSTWVDTGYDFLLVRYNSDGSQDSSFGDGGVVRSAIGPGHDAGYAVAVQPDGQILVAGQVVVQQHSYFGLVRYNVDGSLDLSFGGIDSLGGATTFVEGGPAVVLDSSVSIYDAELAAQGSYAGASVTLARSGGANSDDLFGASGALSGLVEGESFTCGGVAIGIVAQNSSGTLVLTFGADATQARINAALSSITYVNRSDAPPSEVHIEWTFSDGNTGAQGTGGARSAQGATTVSIQQTNDTPIAHDDTYDTGEDGPLTGSVLDNDTDPDAGDTLTVTTTGTLTTANGGTVEMGANGVFLYTPAANWSGTDSFEYEIRDGAGQTSAATVTVNVAAVADAPSIEVSPGDGIEDTALPLAISLSLTDTDGSEEVASIVISGLPAGFSLSAGTQNGDGSWSLTQAQLAGLQIIPAADYTGSFTLTIVATSRETSNGDTASSTQDITVSFGDIVDTITGGAGNDILIGTIGADDLRGMGGHDTLVGGSGNDVLSGGEGNDRLLGGVGDDMMDGGNGSDIAGYADAASGVTVNLSVTGPQDTGGAGIDTLTGIESLRGSGFDDRLEGDGNANELVGAGGNDTLAGAAGNDRLLGGAGDDLIEGGEGMDAAIYSYAAGAVTVSLAVSGAQDTGEGLDTLVGIENLRGSAFGDRLDGNDSANVIIGAAGDDTISGGAGRDALQGGAGNDVLSGDQITDLADDGTDTVSGGDGDDVIYGRGGDDRLYGGTGADTIEGGAGRDVLDGGAGSDHLYGGAGVDAFVFNSALGDGSVDVVVDFTRGEDVIRLENAVFTALGAASGPLAAGALAVLGGAVAGEISEATRVIYDAATGALSYDADGSGAAEAVQFATLSAGLELTSASFRVI